MRTPFDGTVYDLQTGKGALASLLCMQLDCSALRLLDHAVLQWCPKDNPLRFVLGTIKVSKCLSAAVQYQSSRHTCHALLSQASAQQEPLEVYPAEQEDGTGDIFVKYP